jgi:hypothetical protein
MSSLAFVALIAAALYGRVRHPPAEVSANVVTSALRFVYHPVAEGAPGPEKPLLSGAPLETLSVRSFDTLTASTGVLSVRNSAKEPWTVIRNTGPIVIRSKDSTTKAIFSGSTIERWRFGQAPAVTLEFVNRQPMLHAVLEGKDVNLFFDAGESIEFQCQLCLVEGVDQNAPSLARQMKLSELNQIAPMATSRTTMILDILPGTEGLGSQRFRMSQPLFCGGQGPELESSVVSGTVKFPRSGREQELVGQASANREDGVLRLLPSSTFVVTALSVVPEKTRRALEVQFDGLAHTAELSARCGSGGRNFLPSVSEVLANTPVVATPYAALLILFGWLGLYDQVQGLWKRVRGKEDAK